jgi:hypothetical protein
MVILDGLNPANVTTMDYSNVRAAQVPAAEFNINLLTN